MTQQRAVVDSSGWIELFTNGPLADRFLAPATARSHQARLYTLDADFKDLHDVELMQRL